MCTAITLKGKHSYFGRNLDLEYHYNETVTITPRNYPFRFRKAGEMKNHYAMIGMAFVAGDYPLYYDAVNEHGLAMAGLNFPGNAQYYEAKEGYDNITPFEFIPWLLSQAKDLSEVKVLLDKINLWNEPFSDKLPLSPLHWIISDKENSITVEATQNGMKVYDNPVGVMTNNPTFDFMMSYLSNFRDITPKKSVNRFSDKIELPIYCQGLAGIGLPGDYSSMSRFVRAAFVKLNSAFEDTEESAISQFFHILQSVEMQRGCVDLDNGVYDITIYSSCCNQHTGVYYYITYDNRRITAVDMHKEDLDSDEVISYELKTAQDILFQN